MTDQPGENRPWTLDDDIEVYVNYGRADLLSCGVVMADGKRTLVIHVADIGNSGGPDD